MAADMAVGRGCDEIAAAKPAHVGAQFLDDARHLVAQNHRHPDASAERAIAHHDVVEANPAGGDRDPDLARTSSRAATSSTRRTSGGPVRSTTRARIKQARAQSAPSQPEMIFHLPFSAFMIAPDNAPACRSFENVERPHQAGIVALHAFERRDDRALVGLSARALEHLGEDLAGLIAVHAVARRLGIGLVFLLRGDEVLLPRACRNRAAPSPQSRSRLRQGTCKLEGLGIAERVMAARIAVSSRDC